MVLECRRQFSPSGSSVNSRFKFRKGMKIAYLKLKNWLLLTALGVLGLSACGAAKTAAEEPAAADDNKVQRPRPRDEIAVMYGVPTMNFTIKGKVLDEAGQPVKGAQVVLVNQTVDIEPDRMEEDNPYVMDYLRGASDTTDAAGSFQAAVRDVPVDVQRVIVRDIDGEANGSFANQMFEVKFTEGDQTRPGKGWDRGDRVKEITVRVEKK